MPDSLILSQLSPPSLPSTIGMPLPDGFFASERKDSEKKKWYMFLFFADVHEKSWRWSHMFCIEGFQQQSKLQDSVRTDLFMSKG